MKKSLALSLMAVLLLASILGCGTNTGSSSQGENPEQSSVKENELKGEIVVWSFTNDLDYVIEHFNKRYPDIKVKFTQIPFDDYVTKLRSVLQVGSGAPDVFFMEVSFQPSLIDNPALEDLSQPPYNAEQYLSDQFEYVSNLSRDKDGKVRAISWQATPGGFYYRRDLAKTYFGTDDPKEISSLISSWDKVMDLGEKVYQESNGKIHLFANWSAINTVQAGNATTPWVMDEKLNIDPAMLEVYDLAKEARDRNVEAKLEGPGVAASQQQGTVIFYPLPSWGLHYVLKANAPDTSGLWGLTEGPAPFWGGGTWIGIYSKSKKKDLAWEFVKFYTLDKEFLKQYAIDQGDFISSVSVAEEVASNQKQPFLNGQNNYEFLIQIANKIKSIPVTKYDNEVKKAFSNSVQLYLDGKATKEEAIEQFKKDVKTAYPEIQVE